MKPTDRELLIENLRANHFYSPDEADAARLKAADMLAADTDLRTQLARRTVERVIRMAAGIDAQQVAVPQGWQLVPVEPTATMRDKACGAWLDCGSKLHLNKALAAMRAGIAAAPQPPQADAQQVAVPHGYAIVPIEPTIEMEDAANRLERHNANIYKAMLKAAPQPPHPVRKPMTERELMACIAKAGCYGTVKMSFESGPYDIDRPSLNASKLAAAIESHHGIKEQP